VDDRELHRIGDRVFDDVVVAFFAAADRHAGGEGDERLLHLHQRVDLVVLAVEVRLREPRLGAELPETVPIRMEEEVAADLEADLDRRVRGDRFRQADDDHAGAVIERQIVARLVGHFRQRHVALLARGVEHLRVQREAEDALRAGARLDRLRDREPGRFVRLGDERVVEIRQQETRVGEGARGAAEGLFGDRDCPVIPGDDADARVADLLQGEEALRLRLDRVERVPDWRSAARELGDGDRGVRRVELAHREEVRGVLWTDERELVAMLAERVGETVGGAARQLRQRDAVLAQVELLERALEHAVVAAGRERQVGCLLRFELEDLRLERLGGRVLVRPFAGEEETDLLVAGHDARGAAGGEVDGHVVADLDRRVVHGRGGAGRGVLVRLDERGDGRVGGGEGEGEQGSGKRRRGQGAVDCVQAESPVRMSDDMLAEGENA
jgi:hypothetical protein